MKLTPSLSIQKPWFRFAFRKARPYLMGLILGYPLFALTQSLFLFWLKTFFDFLSQKKTLPPFLFLRGMSWLTLRFFLGSALNWVIFQFGAHLTASLRFWSFEAFLKLPGSQVANISLDQFNAKMSQSLQAFQDQMSYRFLAALRDAVFLIGFLLVVFCKLPLSFALTFTFFCLFLMIFLGLSHQALDQTYQKLFQSNQKLNHYLFSLLERLPFVQIEQTQPFECETFKKHSLTYKKQAYRSHVIRNGSSHLTELIVYHGLLLLLIYRTTQEDSLFVAIVLLAAYRPLKSLGTILFEIKPIFLMIHELNTTFDPLQKPPAVSSQPPSSPYLFEIHHLKMSFHSKQSLSIPLLQIQPGEALWLKGPSGSGKTSCLRLFAGLRNSPEAFIKRTPKTLYLSQSPQWFQGTLQENLELSGLSPSLFQKYFQLLGLENFQNRLNEELQLDEEAFSGGEAIRLSLLRGILFQPDLLLLDEPFGQLDFENQKKVANTLKTWLKETQGAFILTSHQTPPLLSFSQILTLREQHNEKTLVHCPE